MREIYAPIDWSSDEIEEDRPTPMPIKARHRARLEDITYSASIPDSTVELRRSGRETFF